MDANSDGPRAARAPERTDGLVGRPDGRERLDGRSAPDDAVPAASRVAGGLLAVLGIANAGVGVAAFVLDQQDVSLLVAAGLTAAGLATVVLARFVWRAHQRATYLGLVIFELLLVPRLLTLGDASGPEIVSLIMLVTVVLALGVAAWRLRRHVRRRRGTPVG